MANLSYQDAESAWRRFKLGESFGGSSLFGTKTKSGTIDINSLFDWDDLDATYNGLSAPEQPDLSTLKSQYANVASAYDPTDTIAAILQAAQNTFSAGKQAANNAARSYAATQQQAGATAAGADVVKSQALLPYLTKLAESKTEAAKYKDEQKANAFNAATQIAKTVSELEQGYYNTLADFISQQNSYATSRYNAQLGALADLTKTQLNAALQAAALQAETEANTLNSKLNYYKLREATKIPTTGTSYTIYNRGLVSGNLGTRSKSDYQKNPYLYTM